MPCPLSLDVRCGSIVSRNLPFVHACEQASGGELAAAVAGGITRDDVTELGAVLIGEAAGRSAVDEITIFDSTGLAIQDLAIAIAVYERAGELELPLLDL